MSSGATDPVLVLGGGVAGLAAALRLSQAGHEVVVLEAGPTPGGVVGTVAVDGYLHERAASSFLGSADDGAAALCDELGVAVQAAAPAARSRWIYLDGALRRLPRNPLELVTTDLLTWRGKLDLVREPLRPGRDPAHAGDESIHAFAARRLGPEVARAIVAPFVTGIFAADAHAVSLAAGFPKLAALDADGGLVRGALRQGLRRLAGVTASSPRRRHPRGLLAPVGGMQAMVTAMAERLGPALRCGVTARALVASGDGVEVVTDTGRVRGRGVVLALPARATAELVAGADPVLAARLTGFQRAPAAVLYLGYPAAAVPRAADGFGLLVAQGEAARLLGVVFESTVWPGRAPAGHVLLRCIYGGARDPGAVGLDDDALVAAARADLARTLGVSAAPTHVELIRWPAGIAQYPVGHRERVAELDGRVRASRMVLAGADYHGVGLNDVIADARRVVREVAGWRA